MERRKFIRLIGTTGTAFVVFPELLGCSPKQKAIPLELIGADKKRGHAIRDHLLQGKNTVEKEIDTLIIGGGITGLACAYQLKKGGFSDFELLEMGEKVGGNSASGENKFSAYPLGAHYLTLPNPENRPLIAFLKELGLITRENPDGSQEYHEAHLCHAPDERLLYRGVFQEGFVPAYGLGEKQQAEIARFFELMEEFKQKRGNDGKYLFDIPLTNASKDPVLEEYDKISFDAFLEGQGFKIEELTWFLDYCCRDDFGAGSDKVSAWSGINYFAGRKSNPSNTIPSNVLTWPEGNGYLVNVLKKASGEQTRTGMAVYSIQENEDHVEVSAYDFERDQTVRYRAGKVVLCSPTYVTKHILQSPYWTAADFEPYQHHPWLVSVVVLDKIPEATGLELAWDNVRYGTQGLGYIYNQHQEFTQLKDKYVINVYLAFDQAGDRAERQKMFSLSLDEMKQLVLGELKAMHPKIEEHILSMQFQQWGHGMVTPYPGSLQKHYDFSQKNSQSPRLRLAHTDYSGYSIFEEGFSQGLEAARFILGNE